MFEYAEHAIAMGRHDSVLDPYAEFVTKTVENDGIAYAMKHYGLI
jgi:hydroxymethylpyrimidine pyrophosphatase-like HAD family hydrolase